MKNILVTGSNGQLGNEMRLLGATSSNNYIFTDVAELDITSLDAVKDMVRNNAIEVIINCAAYTNVDKAEDDILTANLINNEAVRNLALAADEFCASVIHISTDYVFDGSKNTPYSESDKTSPLGVYGTTKLNGELALLGENGGDNIVIRTSWLYSEFGNNFVKTIARLSSEKKQLSVVFDQVGTPTYAGDLAAAIFDIVENNKYQGNKGVYHFSNEGVCSWFDFARSIAIMSNNNDCEVLPCYSSQFPSKVTRPSYSVLDKSKFKETFGFKIPYWSDSLFKCITKLRGDRL